MWVWNMWVVYFVQEGFQDESPGDFGSLFIKAWDSETNGLRIEKSKITAIGASHG